MREGQKLSERWLEFERDQHIPGWRLVFVLVVEQRGFDERPSRSFRSQMKRSPRGPIRPQRQPGQLQAATLNSAVSSNSIRKSGGPHEQPIDSLYGCLNVEFRSQRGVTPATPRPVHLPSDNRDDQTLSGLHLERGSCI